MPRLLDLCCGPGFAARGYHAAGWDVTGVDVDLQPLYPFAFQQKDALDVLRAGIATGALAVMFDAIHASPPCPRYSSITAISGHPEDHPDLIAPMRELLEQTGLLWAMENVPRSPLRSPYVICGTSMGCQTVDGRYRLARHRHFETNFPLLVPPCSCANDPREVLGVYGGGTRQSHRRDHNGGATNKANTQQSRELYGIVEELPRRAMNLGFPPSYTELVGQQMLAHVPTEAAA